MIPRLGLILVPLVCVFFIEDEPPAPAFKWPTPRGYVCYRTDRPVAIDGKLDDSAWANAPWSEDFVDIEGESKPHPRLRTRMKMLWDEKNLYIAAELYEPHLWATYQKHDSVIFHENDFEVFLDPDGDHLNYCELELNARNTTWDLLLTKPYRARGVAINGWEIQGLQSAVHLDGTLNEPADEDRGWTLEIAWPFSGLTELAKIPPTPRDGDQWRINFSRVEWDTEVRDGKYQKIPKRAEHNWVWSPQGVIDMHRPWHWGYLQFSQQKSGNIRVREDPTRPIHHALIQVYEAQLQHLLKTGTYTDSLAILNLDPRTMPAGFTLEKLAHSYEARIPAPGLHGHSWIIDQDSWLRKVGPMKKN